jgi:Ca2+-binding RTX toxin-like protein
MAETVSIINNQWIGTSQDDRVDPLQEYKTNGVTYFDALGETWMDNLAFNNATKIRVELSSNWGLIWYTNDQGTEVTQNFNLVNFEGVDGTSGNDFIYGDNSRNFIRPNGGNDYISGGQGQDTVSFEGDAYQLGVNVNLNSVSKNGTSITQGATVNGSTVQVNLISIEGIHGSWGGDTIHMPDPSIMGNSSNGFYVFGRSGNDTIYSYGDTNIIPGSGSDSVIGTIQDTVSYSNLENDNLIATKGISLTATGRYSYIVNDPWGNNDNLSGIGRIEGTDYNDIVTDSVSTSGSMEFKGLKGDDTFQGGAGNDVFYGGEKWLG